MPMNFTGVLNGLLRIQNVDIITIDMGCKVNGYCSDMTRTFFVGNVPEYVKPVYNQMFLCG